MTTEHPIATPPAIAAHIANALRRAIAERGQASLAVSGGKSPVAMFEALRRQPLDWAKLHVVLVDERVVPHDHADSNTALVRQYLLQGVAAAAQCVPFFDQAPREFPPSALDALVAQAKARMVSVPWPLDVAVLGMGEDAHTASLFPGAPGTAEALQSTERVAWVVPTTAPHARLTLTLSSLLAARELVLTISGEKKLAVYRRAAQKADAALPVSLVIHQAQTPLSVWMS
ncbi:MAG: 6-phosphogluconolactonase [Hydrogenophaga sp.]